MTISKNNLTSTLKSKFGKADIDVTIACELRDALKAEYGDFDLECLDSDDFQIGGFFTEEEAKELVILASLDGQKDLDTLGHLMLYGF